MANGSVVGQIASIQDITELKRAMEVLEAERASLQQTIEIQNRERVLTAYEIHDGIVQHVTAALLHIQAALPKITTSDVNGKLQVAVKLLRKSIAEGRHIMNGVQTPTLAGLGLIPTIEQLLAEDDQVEIPVDFIHDGNLGQLAPQVEEAIFRIAQEALTNARKYSQSNRIRIEIARRGDRVHLDIRDSGVGFTVPAGVKGVHGLKGMIERARIAGGNCVIKSEPGKGAQVIVDLPYLSKK
jgi:signal transduction histidine kinase